MAEQNCSKPIAARGERGYQLWVRFADGLEGRVSLANLIDIGAFRMLRDPSEFADVFPDSTTGAVIWRAGVRLDAEVLYYDIAAHGGLRHGKPIHLSEQVDIAKRVTAHKRWHGQNDAGHMPPHMPGACPIDPAFERFMVRVLSSAPSRRRRKQ